MKLKRGSKRPVEEQAEAVNGAEGLPLAEPDLIPVPDAPGEDLAPPEEQGVERRLPESP